MNNEIVIGMDCGASHSTLKVWRDGQVEYENHSLPGANFDLFNQVEIRNRFLVEFEKLATFEKARWVVGMAGLDDKNEEYEADIWFRSVLDSSLPYSSIRVMSDCELLLWSGNKEGVGIALVAGTGSSCLARSSLGETKKIGGMSHLLSDEGGGFSLGWKCLHLVTKMVDGREKRTDLVNEVFSFFNVDNLTELKNYLLQSNLKVEVARVAPLILSASERGDSSAQVIVLEEVGELVCMVETANKYFEQDDLSVFISGSVFKNFYYKEQFLLDIRRLKADQKITSVRPIDGAINYTRHQQNGA